MGNMWPRIAEKPTRSQARRSLASSWLEVRLARRRMAREKTRAKYLPPRSLATLVAPMFPEPDLRGSMPRQRPTRRPKGMEPRKYVRKARRRSFCRGDMEEARRQKPEDRRQKCCNRAAKEGEF